MARKGKNNAVIDEAGEKNRKLRPIACLRALCRHLWVLMRSAGRSGYIKSYQLLEP